VCLIGYCKFHHRDIKEGLAYFGVDPRIFKRLAITREQIRRFNLPYNPDKQTQDKLDHDARTRGFIEKYGQIYATELDAFFAVAPNELRLLIQRSIDQHFDEDIYNEVMDMEEHSEESINRLVNERVRFVA
jgi:hypothetical protein